MKAIKLYSFCRLKKDIMRRGNKDLDYGLGDLVIWENKMISTVIIQVYNQRKQMASVCYHSFYRRQRLRSRWCWLLVPSGCWMWLGKEWKTAKTTVSCIAKVTARAFHHALEVLKPERCKTAPNELGGEYKVKWDPLFLFPLCISLTCIFSKDYRIVSFFFPPVQHKTKGV